MSQRSAIAVILDRSGSMSSIREATISGFNEFVSGQKEAPDEANLMLVQFDNHYQVDYDKSIREVAPLDETTYEPRGTTALLDAIGRTINWMGAKFAAMPVEDRPHKVVCVIITDGEENASTEFTRKQIFSMITHQQKTYAWEFMFLGANQDAITEGARYGIPMRASMQYAPQTDCVRSTFRSVSRSALHARAGRPVSFGGAARAAAMGKPIPRQGTRPAAHTPADK
jgi:hypothetical protein